MKCRTHTEMTRYPRPDNANIWRKKTSARPLTGGKNSSGQQTVRGPASYTVHVGPSSSTHIYFTHKTGYYSIVKRENPRERAESFVVSIRQVAAAICDCMFWVGFDRRAEMRGQRLRAGAGFLGRRLGQQDPSCAPARRSGKCCKPPPQLGQGGANCKSILNALWA